MLLAHRAFLVPKRVAAVLATAVTLFLCILPASAAPVVIDVAASLPMVGEWTKAVGGEHVRVRVIAPESSDPHTFEPSVRSMQAVNRAQVVFVIGLGLEPWAERLMRADPALNIVPIAPAGGLRRIGGHAHAAHHHCAEHSAKSTSTLAQKTDPVIGHDCSTHTATGDTATCTHTTGEAHGTHVAGEAHVSHGDHCAHGEFDPHVWLDPLRVKEMVRIIQHTLSTHAPQHVAVFRANANAYCERLDELDAQVRVILAPIEASRRKLVTNHDNLHYFAERYDFIVLETLFGAQGAASGQPSARRVREIVARIHENNVEALFADAGTSRNLLEAVAREANIAPVGEFHSIPTGTSGPAPDYVSMMRHNAHEIARLLAPTGHR